MIANRPTRTRHLAFVALAAAVVVVAALATAGNARAAESPQGRIVSQIVVVNNKIHTSEAVRALMQTKQGKPYEDITAQQDVGRLLATGRYRANGVELSTSVGTDGQVTVFVTVKELTNTVREVVFMGQEHYSYDELFEIVHIRKGSPMDANTNRRAAHAIAAKLQEDGRYYATCNLIEGENVSDSRVVFNIVEGPKVRIGGVEFRGNSVAGTQRLHTIVSARGPKLLVPTLLTPQFTPGVLDADKKALTTYYHKLGHLDAVIEPEVYPASSDLSTVQIIYHIREGQPYTIRTVKFEGSDAFPEARLKKVTATRAGDRYDVGVVQADMKRISELYGNGGYQVGVNEGLFAVQGQANQVDVHYQLVEPGRGGQRREPDRVGRIIIRGNTVTDQRVILNQLGLFPGQILQYPKLQQAQQNLVRLGIFDTAEDPPRVEVVPQQFDSTFKDVEVIVKETRTGMVGLQVGVNSNAGLNGTLTVNERNFDLFRFPRCLCVFKCVSNSFDDLICRQIPLANDRLKREKWT